MRENSISNLTNNELPSTKVEWGTDLLAHRPHALSSYSIVSRPCPYFRPTLATRNRWWAPSGMIPLLFLSIYTGLMSQSQAWHYPFILRIVISGKVLHIRPVAIRYSSEENSSYIQARSWKVWSCLRVYASFTPSHSDGLLAFPYSFCKSEIVHRTIFYLRQPVLSLISRLLQVQFTVGKHGVNVRLFLSYLLKQRLEA